MAGVGGSIFSFGTDAEGGVWVDMDIGLTGCAFEL
jgi:hypothetical protein